MNVSRNQFGLVEESIHKFVIEASTLGLVPGRVPEMLTTDLGNGQPLLLERVDDEVFVYRQALGCIEVHVLND